ncbi:hypothetical protein [Thiomicrorhabdus sp.]|uniref:hypothetical protein n=1 Tax=Thiomicrorhabdus sp. TaxID=2039724 RepID=UPI002AA8ADD1|nr:hypothetical protein [Thiomicrorhabdus sp.]
MSIKLKVFLAALFLMVTTLSHANEFNVGETVFVAYPAANIKDDAFIVGKVNRIMPNGDLKVSVIDYVEGHDYGVSCVPMGKNDTGKSIPSDTDNIWDLWTDTTKLDKEKLDYIVAKKDVLKLGRGKTYFIERNNLYIVFGRWKSDAPMLSAERMSEAEKQAQENGLAEMVPAFELAKLQRKSFYGDFGRPLMPFESVAPMVKALKAIQQQFNKDPSLKKDWFAKNRDWKKISKNTKRYFLIQAIDKIVEDAKNLVYEDGVEDAAPKDLEQLNKFIKELSRK